MLHTIPLRMINKTLNDPCFQQVWNLGMLACSLPFQVADRVSPKVKPGGMDEKADNKLERGLVNQVNIMEDIN
jgi:hypothetical protein